MSLRLSERKLLLAVVDLLIMNGALVFAVAQRTDFAITRLNLMATWPWYLTLSLVWLLVATFFGLYDLARAASAFSIARSSSVAVLVAVLFYTLIPLVTPPLQSRLLILMFVLIGLAGILTWRVGYAKLFNQPWFKHRALVVGAGQAGRTLVSEMKNVPTDANPYHGTGYELMGFVDDDPNLIGQVIWGIPVLGGREVLLPMAEALHVDEIIVAITHRHAIADDLFGTLLRCRELGFQITNMSTLYERLLGRVPVYHIGRDLQMAFPMEDRATHRLYQLGKRLLDVAASLVSIAGLGLIIPPIAVANALWCPGPLFYSQQRVGEAGKPFSIMKFRTMMPDAEQETGAVWAEIHDPRVTPVGRFLRRTRLDELPQAINILRGEMSMIGPRPERPEFVEALADTIPFYRARHAVRPGITGWAQVRFRYGNTEDDARIKLEYDLYYVKYASPLLDLRIVLETIPVMLQFKGH